MHRRIRIYVASIALAFSGMLIAPQPAEAVCIPYLAAWMSGCGPCVNGGCRGTFGAAAPSCYNYARYC